MYIDAFTCKDFSIQIDLNPIVFIYKHIYTHTQTHTFTHTDPLTHRSFYTQTLLQIHTCTHRHVDIQTLFHANPFTHRPFYTQTLLHTNAFTHKIPLYQKYFPQKYKVPLHKNTFIHKNFHIQGASTQKHLPHKHLCTQMLLHTDPFTYKHI